MRQVPGWRRLARFGSGGQQGDSRPDDRVDEELQFHLDGLIEESMADGVPEEEARARALERFGDPRKIARECTRQPKTIGTRRRGSELRTAWDSIWLDLRQALRGMRRRPGITAAILLTLVLGIGATTAVFSVVHAVLLVPPSHPEPEELVLVWEVDQRPGFFENNNRVTAANFRDWQEQNQVFEAMAAYEQIPVTFRGGDEPERVLAMAVASEFFSILRVEAFLGRTFTREEYTNGNDDVVMLSHAFWMSRFGSDPGIVGDTVRIGSTSYPVVGILPASFRYLDEEAAVWTPLAWSEQTLQNRRAHLAHVLARLRDGVTLEEAQRDMDRVVNGLREDHPEFLTGWGVLVERIEDEIVGEIRPALIMLMVAVAFVLLVAAVNVANLMLARTGAERRERALRASLGASRRRLLQQQLIESLSLSLGGGLLGLGAATFGTRLLLALAPATLPRVDRVGIDGVVVLFSLLVSVAAGLVFGIVIAAGRGIDDSSEQLRAGGRGSTAAPSENRLAAGLVVAQLSFSLVLLIAAGLLGSSFLRLMQVDPGFDRSGLLGLKITLSTDVYSDVAEQIAFYDRLLGELEALPGVIAAGVTKFLPLLDEEWTWSVYIEGRERDEGQKLDYGRHVASADFFRAMGIRLLKGRGLRDDDRADRTSVVVVNEAFVDRFFPDGSDPLGQRLSILGEEERMLEIVGVVENIHHVALDEQPLPLYYVPYAQMPVDFIMRQMNVVLRTTSDPAALVPAFRTVLARLDGAIPISDVQTMRERLESSVARWRFAMTLVCVFAGIALLLAVVGTYGVVSSSVTRRVPEIGVRMALGAAPAHVVRQVLAGGLRLTGLGLLAGIPAALLFSRGLTSLLYGVRAHDPMIYAGFATLLALVALLATWLPARRAGRVDPIVALRSE